MTQRRILSIWFPRLGAERALRAEPHLAGAPLAVVADVRGALVLASLSAAAEDAGLRRGMSLGDARAVTPALITRPEDPRRSAPFLAALRRWAGRFSPWAAVDGPEGLALDVTGCAHLFGGEAGLAADVDAAAAALGLSLRLGIADTLGAAWAVARFAGAGPLRHAPMEGLTPRPHTDDGFTCPYRGDGSTRPPTSDRPLPPHTDSSLTRPHVPDGPARPHADMTAQPQALDGLSRAHDETARAPGGDGTAHAHAGDAIDQEARATRSRAQKRRWERGGAPPPPPVPGAPAARILPPGETLAGIGPLPVAALRLAPAEVEALQALGLRRIADVAGLPRAQLTRRLGPGVIHRLDQALGRTAEPVGPTREDPVFALRLTLPEPIGREADVAAGLDRLLGPLCDRLRAAGMGARRVRLTLLRVDRGAQAVEVGLARAADAADAIRPLLTLKLGEIDAGFGIEAMRLEAVAVEPLSPRQHRGQLAVTAAAQRLPAQAPGEGAPQGSAGALVQGWDAAAWEIAAPRLAARQAATRRTAAGGGAAQQAGAPAQRAATTTTAGAQGPTDDAELADLLGRLGARLGLEALTRLHPADSHIPEKAATVMAAGFSEPAASWPRPRAPRPVLIFPPEPVQPQDTATPPEVFVWRRKPRRRTAAFGPERIAPEWWLDDPAWRTGPRDYWRVETEEGQRLWLYETGKGRPWTASGWFAQGVFA